MHNENASHMDHTAICIYKTAAVFFLLKKRYEKRGKKRGILISNFYNDFFSIICLGAHHAEILMQKQKMK